MYLYHEYSVLDAGRSVATYVEMALQTLYIGFACNLYGPLVFLHLFIASFFQFAVSALSNSLVSSVCMLLPAVYGDVVLFVW